MNGQSWNVRIKQNGNRIFTGTRVTQGPSGSFELTRRPNDMRGDRSVRRSCERTRRRGRRASARSRSDRSVSHLRLPGTLVRDGLEFLVCSGTATERLEEDPLATSKVEVVVLGLLAEEPLYGYDLLERFRSRSMGFWVEVGKASVYQTLRRLERDGSIGGRSQDGPEGPDRRVYRITRAGRERLKRGLAERAASLEPYETDGGLALGFIHLLPAADARTVVDEREAAVRDLLDALQDRADPYGRRQGRRPFRLDGDARPSDRVRRGGARLDQGSVHRRGGSAISGGADRVGSRSIGWDDDGSGVLRPGQDDHLAVVVARPLAAAVSAPGWSRAASSSVAPTRSSSTCWWGRTRTRWSA